MEVSMDSKELKARADAFDARDGHKVSTTLLSTWGNAVKRTEDGGWSKRGLCDEGTTYKYDNNNNLVATRNNETGDWTPAD
jgi:hypothetical protein